MAVDDSYTKLLIHCDGADASTTFTDESGKTITTVGNAQVDTAYKVFGTGSLLLDGTGDALTLDDSEDWNFGSGDFTVDFRVKKIEIQLVSLCVDNVIQLRHNPLSVF